MRHGASLGNEAGLLAEQRRGGCPMLDLKAQSQLVEVTATLMRSCITVATGTFAASAWRGLSLWSDLLLVAGGSCGEPSEHCAPAAIRMGGPFWPSSANWYASPRVGTWFARPWLTSDLAGLIDMPWTPFTRTWWLGPSLMAWAALPD